MKSRDLLLITAGIEPGEGAVTRLRSAVRTARRLGLNPILVLGPEGDDVLMRLGPEMETCEFAFDPNFDGKLFSSVLAGLQAASGAAFVWPLKYDAADEAVWTELDRAMWSLKPDEDVDVIRRRPVAAEPVFPQLVTLKGVRRLRALPAATEWERDERIRATEIAD